MQRTPFPVPFGWYHIAWPTDVEPGEVKPLFYFERDLVLWRDTDGGYHLQDAICPHLGGHLGHGGHVENCEIMCPFHGWHFDAEGCNSKIPYSEKVNRSAKLRTYPVIERNGLIMAWYHPFDEEPKWEIPEIPEFNDPDNFADAVGRSYLIPAAWQEIAENSVDTAHFRYVHNTEAVPQVTSYEQDGFFAHVRSKQKFPTPRGVVDGKIDIDQYGPGFSVIRFSGIVDTVLLGCNIPVTSDECQMRFTFTVRKQASEELTSSVGEAFVAEVSQQIVEDLPIWRYKAYIPKPALADVDGPYMQFRSWAKQFYAEGVEFDRPVYPALRPDVPEPSAEGMEKFTASSRIKGENRIVADMMK